MDEVGLELCYGFFGFCEWFLVLEIIFRSVFNKFSNIGERKVGFVNFVIGV